MLQAKAAKSSKICMEEVRESYRKFDAEIAQVRLGYAIVHIASSNDEGKNPLISVRNTDWNPHVATDTHLQTLERFNHHYAMSISVYPDAIDMASVSVSFKPENHKRLRWNPGFRAEKGKPVAVLFDGAHCKVYLEKIILKAFIETRDAAMREKRELHKKGKKVEDVQALVKVIDNANQAISKGGTWLVMLYNLGTFQTSL
jgi:hypothetical protein